MATCLVTLNVGFGGDLPANGTPMTISRLAHGDNGELEIFAVGSPIPLTVAGTQVSLEQDTEYVFSSAITGRVYRKTPASATAYFGPHGADMTLIEYVPMPPDPTVMGDSTVNAVVSDAGSATRTTLDGLYVNEGDLTTTLGDYLTEADAATGYQPLDADLTTIAGLTATTDNVIQSVSGSWASRTMAQLKTSLGLVKADVGLGNVDNTTDLLKPISTAQAAVNLTIPTNKPLIGTGFPNGVVTAPVGTSYTDTAVTNGAYRWEKKSGTGNTGWVCVDGDTGWRNVASSLVNGWAPNASTGVCAVNRVGRTVYWQLGLSGASATSQIAIYLATGFSISVGYSPGYAPLAANTSSGGYAPLEVHSYGYIRWSLPSGFPSIVRAYGAYSTTDVWPSTLPGTPA